MKLLASCADALASPRVARDIVRNLTICCCLLNKRFFVTNILDIMLLAKFAVVHFCCIARDFMRHRN